MNTSAPLLRMTGVVKRLPGLLVDAMAARSVAMEALDQLARDHLLGAR